MFDWSEIKARSVDEIAPFSIVLSEESRVLILDLLGFASEGWPIRYADAAGKDERDAAVSLAIDEVLTPIQSGGSVEHIKRLQGSSAVGYTLNPIATDYAHFKIIWAARTVRTGTIENWWMRFNFDNGSNYEWSTHRYSPDQNNTAGNIVQGDTELSVSDGAAADDSPEDDYVGGVFYILNAQNTPGVPKEIIGSHRSPRTGTDASYAHRYFTGVWHNLVDDITSIEIASSSVEDFTDETFFDVYGIRADG